MSVRADRRIRGGLVPKVIPSIRELLTGPAQIEGVRDPRITDLVGRRAARTDVARATGLPTTASRGPLRQPTSG